MSKSREEKLAERKSHVPVAPTPETAQIITEVEPPAPLANVNTASPGVTFIGFDEGDPAGDFSVTMVRTENGGTQITRMQRNETSPDAAFLAFIRSPKGLDLADARVRDVFDQEHRLKEAFRAGWEAARA